MSAPAPPRLMTTEELLALPDDGIERWLIRGELREGATTLRNRWHSRTEATFAYLLQNWCEQQPRPRGIVYSGECGFRLARDPDSTVGIDVAYVSPEVAARDPDDMAWIDGPPVLAVEILSPSDTVEQIGEKIQEYLSAGVKLVWIVDPYVKTVVVHQPDAEPELFNVRQQLTAEPHLPGLQVPVNRLFE